MSLVNPDQVSPGDQVTASSVNTPVNQLADIINGNIENVNIKTGAAIDGDKLAAASIPGSRVLGGAWGLLKAIHYYTYDGTDIFVDGVDQNNGANTINWTKPSGLNFVIVEVIGGGGAGGGANATGSGTVSAGDGGSGGVYARSKIAAASLGSTETVTVGAKGAKSSGATGGNGGTSSFGSHASANGGNGGTNKSPATVFYSSGTVVATTGTGDLVIPGGPGGAAEGHSTDNPNKAQSGEGGATPMGVGGHVRAANASGVDAQGYGGGGSGAALGNNQSAQPGGDGAAGIVIVYEYH